MSESSQVSTQSCPDIMCTVVTGVVQLTFGSEK